MFRNRGFDSGFGTLFRRMEEEEMAEMERRANALLRDAIESGQTKRAGPFVWGYTIETGPEGEPRVSRFGNVDQTPEAFDEGWREPFVTSLVDEDDHQLRVTAELPGVDRSDIDVEVLDDEIRIEATNDERKYRKRLRVDDDLDPDSAQASYNNGILEISVDLAKTQPEGRKVDIE